MKALFLGGPQHGVLLNLHVMAPYWDFPVPIKLSTAGLSKQLPDEVQRLDVVRYKCVMISIDRESAIYTQCGDAIDALTQMRDWVADMDPVENYRLNRRPQPVYFQPRKEAA